MDKIVRLCRSTNGIIWRNLAFFVIFWQFLELAQFLHVYGGGGCVDYMAKGGENNMKGYKLVLRRLGDDKVEIAVTDHTSATAPTYSIADCRQIAGRFMGKSSAWQHRRPDIWTNGNILLGIYPFYPGE